MRLELSHPDPQQSIELLQFPIIIGLNPKTKVVSLDDSSIGHYQCMIDRHEDRFMVWDLGTQLGTKINGVRISGNTILSHGDILAVGENQFVVHINGNR